MHRGQWWKRPVRPFVDHESILLTDGRYVEHPSAAIAVKVAPGLLDMPCRRTS